jgi:ribose transport system ATP-binding protein
MTVILSVRGLTKRFDATVALHPLDLDIRAGEVTALVGENGAGKSTLLNLISGALRPDGGTMELEGEARHWADPRDAIRAGITIVHQELSILPALSVAENIFLGDYKAKFGLIDRGAMTEGARRLLSDVGASHVEPLLPAGRLRIADQQSVEIAKALHIRPKLMLLDEPTSSLTRPEVETLFRVVRGLARQGIAIVFISHRLDEVTSIANRVVVLRDGRLVSDRPAADATRGIIITDMTGRAFDLARAPPPRPPATAPVALAVGALSDGAKVGPVSFELRRGEILGVFGLVGAGRTELLEMIAGARPLATGSVSIAGREVRLRSIGAAWRAGLAFLPEGRKINGIAPQLGVAENVVISARQAGASLLSPRADISMYGEASAPLRIKSAGPQQAIRYLSGGNQQKAILARCLATKPAVLLLDEPTHGVDVGTKSDVYGLIRRLATEGMAVIFVSSELPEVLALASTVMVMAGGQVTHYSENRSLEEEHILAAAFATSGLARGTEESI